MTGAARYERPAPAVVLETLTGETLGDMIGRPGPRRAASELGVCPWPPSR